MASCRCISCASGLPTPAEAPRTSAWRPGSSSLASPGSSEHELERRRLALHIGAVVVAPLAPTRALHPAARTVRAAICRGCTGDIGVKPGAVRVAPKTNNNRKEGKLLPCCALVTAVQSAIFQQNAGDFSPIFSYLDNSQLRPPGSAAIFSPFLFRFFPIFYSTSFVPFLVTYECTFSFVCKVFSGSIRFRRYLFFAFFFPVVSLLFYLLLTTSSFHLKR